MDSKLASETQPLRQCMERVNPYRDTAMMPTMIRVDRSGARPSCQRLGGSARRSHSIVLRPVPRLGLADTLSELLQHGRFSDWKRLVFECPTEPVARSTPTLGDHDDG